MCRTTFFMDLHTKTQYFHETVLMATYPYVNKQSDNISRGNLLVLSLYSQHNRESCRQIQSNDQVMHELSSLRRESIKSKRNNSTVTSVSAQRSGRDYAFIERVPLIKSIIPSARQTWTRSHANKSELGRECGCTGSVARKVRTSAGFSRIAWRILISLE